MTPKRGLTPATGAVHSLLQSHELARVLRPHLAKACWAEVVGPQVAGVAQIERVQNGTELVVRVKNSVWANELVLLKGDMLSRLNRALGGQVLTDIHFKASGLPRRRNSEAPHERPLPKAPSDDELAQILLPAETRDRIEMAVCEIKEDALRGRIRRTLARAARMEQWKRNQGWQPCSRCQTLTFPSPVSAPPLLCALCHAGAI